MRPPIGRQPQVLHTVGGQQPLGCPLRVLAQSRRGRRRQRLRCRREQCLQLGRHVDVGIELVDQVSGERLLDLGLLQQLGGGGVVAVGVEHDAPDPQRQHRDRTSDARTISRDTISAVGVAWQSFGLRRRWRLKVAAVFLPNRPYCGPRARRSASP
jgi:hypothetical protein